MESETNKLFVGGITQSTDEENLREYFSKYGEVKRAQVMRDRFTGLSRGFGFVSFSDQSSMESALQNEDHEILGRRVAVNIPKPIEKKPPRQVSLNHSNQNSSPLKINKIFVGGLPPSLTKGEFDSYFETFGRIVDSVIMYNKENKPRGFGFVTYDSEESVQKVLMDRFHQLSDKWVDVKRAIPRGEPQITFYTHDSYQTYWGYVNYYNMYATQMGVSNAQYHGQQVWVNNPNFVLYPSYHQNMPLGQPGNSYVHPMYVGNHVDRNGMQKDEGSSSSSDDIYGNGVTIQEAEVVENGASGKPNDEISKVIIFADDEISIQEAEVVEIGASGKPNDEISKVIIFADDEISIQGAEVVENGASGKPNDEISKVIIYADDVAETASDCSLCDSPKVVENGACGMPKNEVAKIANRKAPSSEVVEHVELAEQILNADCGIAIAGPKYMIKGPHSTNRTQIVCRLFFTERDHGS